MIKFSVRLVGKNMNFDSLMVCSRWLNKVIVDIAPSVCMFVLLFQNKILF